jgi:hypothetical protein
MSAPARPGRVEPHVARAEALAACRLSRASAPNASWPSPTFPRSSAVGRQAARGAARANLALIGFRYHRSLSEAPLPTA